MNKSLNLMIIDDDSICNFINTRVAQTSGLFNEIRSLSTGNEALANLDMVSNGTGVLPDIILLDLNMPVMNGFDFIDKIQHLDLPDKERMSIVILTSSNNKSDMMNAQSVGVTHYLQKPLTLKDLQSVVYSLNKTKDSQPTPAPKTSNPIH